MSHDAADILLRATVAKVLSAAFRGLAILGAVLAVFGLAPWSLPVAPARAIAAAPSCLRVCGPSHGSSCAARALPPVPDQGEGRPVKRVGMAVFRLDHLQLGCLQRLVLWPARVEMRVEALHELGRRFVRHSPQRREN
jgi:hypothetical protein